MTSAIPRQPTFNYLTRLGHSVFLADLVADACTGDGRAKTKTAERSGMSRDFSISRFDFSGRKFDVVLLWTALDYLPEALVEPVVDPAL